MESRHSIPVIEEQIKRADKIAILAHINPDIDAIASLVSLKNIIKEKYENK
jgi:nanoRNase/pAp phosphatase (c-di-AMP/oligoRNAs hydrolase)